MSVQQELVKLGKEVLPDVEEKDLMSTSVEGIIRNITDHYTPPEGTPGPQGVGIKTITGTIDGSNKLTLVFTLTDDSQQTVEGTITPPAAG